MDRRAHFDRVLLDLQATLREVDVTEAQGCRFGPPDAGVPEDENEQFVSFGRDGEGAELLVCEVSMLVFICQHNAGRSQLGAHLLDYVAGDRFRSTSGGLSPADAINPAIAASLGELGIDTSAAVPRAVTADDLADADIVVTMKPGLALPGPVGGELVEWQFPDPATWEPGDVRSLRDEVLASVRALTARADGAARR